MGKTLGQIGYEKWLSLLDPAVKAGLPSWGNLPAGSRLGWDDVALAVVVAYDKAQDEIIES